jgi:hypothetical protein
LWASASCAVDAEAEASAERALNYSIEDGMKLVDLDPRWLTPEVMVFRCPACNDGLLSLKSVAMTIRDQMALFHEKLGEPLAGQTHPCDAETLWTFSGTDFHTFSASPSLNIEGHWHKTITNGNIQ